MQVALVRAGPAMLASAGTVVAALLCLTLASVNSTAGLGPVGAMGVSIAAAAMLTLLPGLLLVGGRRAFWPYVPHAGSGALSERRRGVWERLGTWIEGRCRAVWIIAALALGALALGVLTLDDNLTTANSFRGSVESVEGQQLVAQSFPAGASAPTVVLVRDRGGLPSALAAARSAEGVATVGQPELGSTGRALPGHAHERPLRREGVSPHTRPPRRASGGCRGIGARRRSDSRGGRSAQRDRARHEAARPARVLAGRAHYPLTAPALARRPARTRSPPSCCRFSPRLAGACSSSSSSPTFRERIRAIRSSRSSSSSPSASTTTSSSMARVREEALELPTRAAMLKGLAVTGGVITSAGIVLAGTFVVLAVLPLVALTQIGRHGCLRRPARHFPCAIHPRPGDDDRLGRAHLVALGACAPRAGRAEMDTQPA